MPNSYNDYAQARLEGDQNGFDAPLGDLDIGQYTYASFIYPMDLGSPGSGKDHYMVFHINETSTTQFKTRAVNGSAPTDEATYVTNAKKDQAAGLGTTTAAPVQQGGETKGQSGGDAQPTAFDAIRQPIRRVATTIVLYMPNEITTGYEADWEAEELGAAADLTNKLKGSGSWEDVFKSFGASGMKEAGGMLNQFTGLNLKDALSRQGRLVINNHREVIFNGIGFRSFSFNFRFTPNSEQEAINVDNIIRAFKFYAAPEVLQGTAGRFWEYPAEFDLQYYANGKENLFLNKISTCALTNIQVNYTPTGHWSAHRPHSVIQGTPSVCTDVTLTFKELEIMTKQRVLEGY